MIDYTKLLSIAQKLGVQSDIAEATKLAARAENKNVPLVLPLVGEFSAGKTTLVNALIDSKVLIIWRPRELQTSKPERQYSSGYERRTHQCEDSRARRGG